MIATLPALDASTESSFLVEKAHHEDWKRRLHLFYVHLQSWRVRARHTSLATFIWELFEETGYDAYVGGLSGGKQRQANVQALYDKAKTFEKTSFRGIFRFLRFVDRMEEQGDDLESARTLSEKEDVVTILSIHKSKGLEFPVVFVVDMMKNFNLSDSRRSIQIHQSLGFGSSYFDTKRRIKRKTLPELAIKEAQKREQMSEELRILYVALTRAKEKLFLIGSSKGVENSLAGTSFMPKVIKCFYLFM
ncbi:3'-5' exonuclease [Geomicrobium sp. JCM 19055]|uniref:3'-5' exonuclease n=1 Tax=Geomicrobium sp. JCM 19055 TaxID=1460649 RepID=UPI0005AA5058|nr:3'-5' exonuclease [Geomicrobium sp. JCM 19055]